MVRLVWPIWRPKPTVSMEPLHFTIGRWRLRFYLAFLLLAYSNGCRSFNNWQLGNFRQSFGCCGSFSRRRCSLTLVVLLSFRSVFIFVILDMFYVFILFFHDCIGRHNLKRLDGLSPTLIEYCILLLLPTLFKFCNLSLQFLVLLTLNRVDHVVARENDSPVEVVETKLGENVVTTFYKCEHRIRSLEASKQVS